MRTSKSKTIVLALSALLLWPVGFAAAADESETELA